jgi:hypothetical protein
LETKRTFEKVLEKAKNHEFEDDSIITHKIYGVDQKEARNRYLLSLEAPHSIFGLMPSSSRIAEQIHGGNREEFHWTLQMPNVDML